MPSRMECPMKSEAQLAIYMDKHESTSQAEVSCTAVPSIEELGKRENVRAKTNERKQRYRARVRSGTDTKTASVLPTSASGALAAFKTAVNTWLPKMDEATRHEALAFVNAWRPTPAPETSHSPCELVKPQRAGEMPIEDA